MFRLIQTVLIIIALTLSAVVNADDKKVPPPNTDMESIQQYLGWTQLLKDSYDIVEDTRDIAKDSELTTILQLQKIGDIYRATGESKKLIDTLEYILKKSQNQTIRNAAYHLLSDRLRDLGEYDKSLEVLKQGLEENLKITE